MASAAKADPFGALKRGDWLTPTRLRNYAIILIAAYAITVIALIATVHGNVGYAGRPIGTDFSDVWIAGRLALRGAPTSAYDPATHYAAQQLAFHRRDIPLYGWAYPPFFLLLASGLALPLYLATGSHGFWRVNDPHTRVCPHQARSAVNSMATCSQLRTQPSSSAVAPEPSGHF